MIVLDTNVVSELMRAAPAEFVVDWVDQLPAEDVYLAAITVAELRYGVARLPHGTHKNDLADRHIGLLLLRGLLIPRRHLTESGEQHKVLH